MSIEKLKLELFIKATIDTLTKNPKAKVVLCFNYIQTIDLAIQELQAYEPLPFYGEIKSEVRKIMIERFQTMSHYRVLVMNTALSVGFNLHDLNGGEPRYMFISPNYKVSEIHQAVGRINRVGMKSPTKVEIIYSVSAAKELDIIEAMTQKTDILNQVHDEQVTSGGIFPGDYPLYYLSKPCSNIDEIIALAVEDDTKRLMEKITKANAERAETEATNTSSEEHEESGAEEYEECEEHEESGAEEYEECEES